MQCKDEYNAKLDEYEQNLNLKLEIENRAVEEVAQNEFEAYQRKLKYEMGDEITRSDQNTKIELDNLKLEFERSKHIYIYIYIYIYIFIFLYIYIYIEKVEYERNKLQKYKEFKSDVDKKYEISTKEFEKQKENKMQLFQLKINKMSIDASDKENLGHELKAALDEQKSIEEAIQRTVFFCIIYIIC